MRTSETIGKIAAALAAAQGEMRPAKMDRVNPHYRSKYASLADLEEASREPLAKHGLCIVQTTEWAMGGEEDGGPVFVLVTRLIHTSGEWFESTYPLDKGKPQDMGSQMTYARRYCRAAIIGQVSDEDDDGEHAQKRAKKSGTKNSTQDRVRQKAQTISQAQVKRLWKIAYTRAEELYGQDDYKAEAEGMVRAVLSERGFVDGDGRPSTDLVPRDAYDEICDKLESWASQDRGDLE